MPFASAMTLPAAVSWTRAGSSAPIAVALAARTSATAGPVISVILREMLKVISGLPVLAGLVTGFASHQHPDLPVVPRGWRRNHAIVGVALPGCLLRRMLDP